MASMAMHLRIAANMIATAARGLAAGWSVQIPPSIKVQSGSDSATISSAVGPSYPNEIPGVRHPVFESPRRRGGRAAWVTNQYRPFLAPACDLKADAAAAEIAKYIDDVAHEDGFH